MKPYALVLLAVATALPAVAGAVLLHGELAAAEVQASNSTLGSGLVGFVDDFTEDPGAVPSTVAGFTLQAETLRVQTYYYDPTLRVGGANGVALQPQASNEIYTAATVAGAELRNNHNLAVFPHGPGAQALVTSPCTRLQPSDSDELARRSYVGYEAPDTVLTVDTSAALLWTSCRDTAEVTVRGSFVVMLWEIDSILRADGQEVALPSGRSRSSYDPTDSAQTSAVLSHDRQRYLYVDSGELRLPVAAGSNHALYLGPRVVLESGTGVSLHGSTGRLAGGSNVLDLAGGALDVTGDVRLELAGTQPRSPFHATLSGTANSVTLDGQPLAWQTTTATPQGAAGLWWAVAVGVLALAFVAGRVPVANALLATASRLGKAHARRTQRLATLALLLRASGRAYFLRSRARTWQGDLQGARADCQEAWIRLPADDPRRISVAWQGFVVCQHLGLTHERAEWLRRVRQT